MFDVIAIILCFLCTDIFATYPSFKVPTVNVTVHAGDTAILPCSVDFLGKHKVVWTDQWSTLLTFHDKRIIDDDRINVERPYTKDWNLLIHDVRYSDKGKYTCQINTKPIKTKHVMLYVLVKPHIVENASSKDVIAKEGETVELVCNVTGVPQPTVHWYRRPLGQSRGSKERVGMHGEILVIHNVSRYCDGIYECMAFNDVPPAVNREMKVEVEFAPEITLPTKRIGQLPGRETMLECVITAFPLLTTNWIYNKMEIKNSHKYRVDLYDEGNHQITLSLRIADISYDDYGNYTCFAKNKMGEDQETMILYDYRRRISTTTTTTTMSPDRLDTSNNDVFNNGMKTGPSSVNEYPKNPGENNQIQSPRSGINGSGASRALLSSFIAIFIFHSVIKCFGRHTS